MIRSVKRNYRGLIFTFNVIGNVVMTGPDPTSPIEVIVHKKEMSKEQQTAMEKLKKLQEEMIGGKRAGDKNLKERRKQKKRAAENR